MSLPQALALHRQGRLAEAELLYRHARASAPNRFEPHYHLGTLCMSQGRFAEAVAFLQDALGLRDGDIATLINLGMALRHLGRPAEALIPLARAIAARPTLAQAQYQHAAALQELGRAAEALAGYDRLLALTPDDAEAWNRRGAVLRTLDRDREALESFDRALGLNPDLVVALAHRGYLRWVVEHRHDDAKADLARALALDPRQPWLEGELFYLKMQGADWDGFAEGRAALAAGIAAGRQVVKPFVWQAIGNDPASLQQCSRIFAGADYPAAPMPANSTARAQGRIRIGYVSADFREQATAYLMAGVYEARNRDEFEITAFDNGFDDAGPMRARLERAFDRFIPIANLSDDQAADAVRGAGIDILVNLNGYFGKPRMGVFARRAAPLQVNYLGFPATLGAPYIDYIVADRSVIPDGDQRFYDEAVVWLPHCYQANDDKRVRPAPARRAEHALPQEAFVFCNFNQGYKLTPDLFAVWLRLLRRHPDSVLWLLHDHDAAIPRLRREAEQQGVAGTRLIFAPMMPQAPHLSRLALADLVLDTLPYNAHTTGSDCLWAGVPLVTCRGSAFPGRVAASLLLAAGLPELIADDLPTYETLASTLASDAALLAGYRARLAQNRATCALFDTARFTRHLEAAWRMMIARQRGGGAPQAFAVPP